GNQGMQGVSRNEQLGLRPGGNKMFRRCTKFKTMLQLATSILFFSALTQAAQATEPAGEAHHALSSPAAPATLAATRSPSISRTVSSERAAKMYSRIWGVDDLTIRATASGSMIRFSYRVVDATKAKVLNDKKFKPTLTDQTSGAKLGVPVMEKIGQLRQT